MSLISWTTIAARPFARAARMSGLGENAEGIGGISVARRVVLTSQTGTQTSK